jgi:hypothetical protein
MKCAIAAVCILTAAPVFAQTPAQEGQPQAAAAASLTCSAPAAPPVYMPAELPVAPTPPKCINLEKNTTTCSNKVFNDWNAKIKAHNDATRARVAEMNAYSRELQKYQHAATDYAQCESNRVALLLPQ